MPTQVEGRNEVDHYRVSGGIVALGGWVDGWMGGWIRLLEVDTTFRVVKYIYIYIYTYKQKTT